jgi:hypothetical protein
MKNFLKDLIGFRILISIICFAFGAVILIILLINFYFYHPDWLKLTWNIIQENIWWWIIGSVLVLLGQILIKIKNL